MDLVRVSALTNFANEIRQEASAKFKSSKAKISNALDKLNPLNTFKSSPPQVEPEFDAHRDTPGWDAVRGGYYPGDDELQIELDAVELYRKLGGFVSEEHRDIYDNRWKTEDPYFPEIGRPKNDFEDLDWVNQPLPPLEEEEQVKNEDTQWIMVWQGKNPEWIQAPKPALISASQYVTSALSVELATFILVGIALLFGSHYFPPFSSQRKRRRVHIPWRGEDPPRLFYGVLKTDPRGFHAAAPHYKERAKRLENMWRSSRKLAPLWRDYGEEEELEWLMKGWTVPTPEEKVNLQHKFDRWWCKAIRRAEIAWNDGYKVMPGALLEFGCDAFFEEWEEGMILEDDDTPRPLPPARPHATLALPLELTGPQGVPDKDSKSYRLRQRDCTPFPFHDLTALRVADAMNPLQPAPLPDTSVTAVQNDSRSRAAFEELNELASDGVIPAYLLRSHHQKVEASAKAFVDRKVARAAKKATSSTGSSSIKQGSMSRVPSSGSSPLKQADQSKASSGNSKATDPSTRINTSTFDSTSFVRAGIPAPTPVQKPIAARESSVPPIPGYLPAPPSSGTRTVYQQQHTYTREWGFNSSASMPSSSRFPLLPSLGAPLMSLLSPTHQPTQTWQSAEQPSLRRLAILETEPKRLVTPPRDVIPQQHLPTLVKAASVAETNKRKRDAQSQTEVEAAHAAKRAKYSESSHTPSIPPQTDLHKSVRLLLEKRRRFWAGQILDEGPWGRWSRERYPKHLGPIPEDVYALAEAKFPRPKETKVSPPRPKEKEKGEKRKRDQFESSTNEPTTSKKKSKSGNEESRKTSKGLQSGAEEPPTIEDMTTSQDQPPSELIVCLAEDGHSSTDPHCEGRKIGTAWDNGRWIFRVGSVGQRERLTDLMVTPKSASTGSRKDRSSGDEKKILTQIHVWMSDGEYRRAKDFKILDSLTHNLVKIVPVKPRNGAYGFELKRLSLGRRIMRDKHPLGDGYTDGIIPKEDVSMRSVSPTHDLPSRYRLPARLQVSRSQLQLGIEQGQRRVEHKETMIKGKEQETETTSLPSASSVTPAPPAPATSTTDEQKISSVRNFSKPRPMRTPTSALATAPVLVAAWSPPSSPAPVKTTPSSLVSSSPLNQAAARLVSSSNSSTQATSATPVQPIPPSAPRTAFAFGLPTPEGTFLAPEPPRASTQMQTARSNPPAVPSSEPVMQPNTLDKSSAPPLMSSPFTLPLSHTVSSTTSPTQTQASTSQSGGHSPLFVPPQPLSSSTSNSFAVANSSTSLRNPVPSTSASPWASNTGPSGSASSRDGISYGTNSENVSSVPAPRRSGPTSVPSTLATSSLPTFRTPIGSSSAAGIGTFGAFSGSHSTMPGQTPATNPAMSTSPVTVLSVHNIQTDENVFSTNNGFPFSGMRAATSDGTLYGSYFNPNEFKEESEEVKERRRKGTDYMAPDIHGVPALGYFLDADGKEFRFGTPLNKAKEKGDGHVYCDEDEEVVFVAPGTKVIKLKSAYEEDNDPQPSKNAFPSKQDISSSVSPAQPAEGTNMWNTGVSTAVAGTFSQGKEGRVMKSNPRIRNGTAPHPTITGPMIVSPRLQPQMPANLSQQAPSGLVHHSMQPSQPTGPSPFAMANGALLIQQENQNHTRRRMMDRKAWEKANNPLENGRSFETWGTGGMSGGS